MKQKKLPSTKIKELEQELTFEKRTNLILMNELNIIKRMYKILKFDYTILYYTLWALIGTLIVFFILSFK